VGFWRGILAASLPSFKQYIPWLPMCCATLTANPAIFTWDLLLQYVFLSHCLTQETSTMARRLRRNPPFRAEHLGSLLRPDDLLKTRDAVEKGTAQQRQLASIEDRAVQDIVDLQIKLGFHAISDGEYRRHSMFKTSGLNRSRNIDGVQCSGARFSLAWTASKKSKTRIPGYSANICQTLLLSWRKDISPGRASSVRGRSSM